MCSSLTSSASRAGREQLDPEDVARAPRPLPRAAPARARALRRHGREVHRRCRDGAVRRSGRARGRPRARGARGARDPRRDRELNEEPASTARAHRRQHRRGVGRARRATAARARAWRRATSSTPPPGCRPPRPSTAILVGEATYRATRARSSTARRGRVEAKGKAEPVPVVGGARGPRALRRRRRAAARAAARRPRARAGRCSLDALARARARARAAARHARRRARHRQEPARVRALADASTRAGADHLAPGPLRSPTATASRSGRSARS